MRATTYTRRTSVSLAQRLRQLGHSRRNTSGITESWWLYLDPHGGRLVIRARDWAIGSMHAVEPQEVFVLAEEPSAATRLDMAVSDILNSDRVFAELVATGHIRLIGRGPDTTTL